MGLLRFILAFGVVKDHTTFFPFLSVLPSGGVSVVLFFVVSGFYMSLVINETYMKLGNGWEMSFLTQRALRLYPAYWTVLLAAAGTQIYLDQQNIFTSSLGLDLADRAFVLFSNIFLIGYDVILTGSILHWYPAANGIGLNYAQFPVMVAWTVAVEITFYIFAAFFALRSSRLAMFALVIGIYFRVYFAVIDGAVLGFSQKGIGLSGNNPWGYHVFMLDLVYFMMGYVSYRIYLVLRRMTETTSSGKSHVVWATIFLSFLFASLCVVWNGVHEFHNYNDPKIWALVGVVTLLIPPLFLVSRKSKVDNFIGMYSYPVYLVHVFASQFCITVLGWPADPWITLISTMIASTFVVLCIEMPMDWIRHNKISNNPPRRLMGRMISQLQAKISSLQQSPSTHKSGAGARVHEI